MFQPDGTSAGVKPLLLAPTQSLTLHGFPSQKSEDKCSCDNHVSHRGQVRARFPGSLSLPAGECPHSTWFFS
jgi:hypothetical protein